MLVLVTYDVNTISDGGERRLRKVAKACTKYGIRVQNSVFECHLDYAEYVKLKAELKNLMDFGKDNIRFYQLGNNYKSHVEWFGKKPQFSMDDTLII